MEEAVDDVVRAPGWAAPIGWSTNPACRAVSLSVGFVALYLALDRLSFIGALHGIGITPWSPSSGLAMALLIIKGLRYAPLVMAAELLSSATLPVASVPPMPVFLESLVVTACCTGAAAILRHAGLQAGIRGSSDAVTLLIVTVINSGLVASGFVASYAVAGVGFDLPIQGLLATSGAIAIILGLALQSTLSDVFSGIVLNFSRPYRPGDWISIDGGTDGRVIEMNWRATHVLTGKSDLAIVPNSTIAKAKIVNTSSPSGIHGMSVTIQLDPKTPPSTGAEILRHAILNTQPILATPSPSVGVKSITADAIEFDLNFSVEELGQSTRAQNDLFDWIYRHLAAAGINWASTASRPTWLAETAIPKNAKTAAERVIDLVAIFAYLTEDERKTLAAKMRVKHYDEGEAIVEPGTVLRSLFVIGAGVVSLTAVMSEGEIEFLRIGPGDHFGEIGMLTGQPAEATLKALVPVTTYELAKEDLAPVLEARPDVSHELCRALAKRQAAGQLIAAAGIDKSAPPRRVAAWFSDRLHRIFDLANAE
jgi:small-conductance mechanosensitive channel